MKNLCVLLPNISHAGLACRGNIPTIAEKYGYECKVHDRSKEGFDEKKEIDAIRKTIGDKKYEKVIIISNSFGDIIARKLLRQGVDNVVAHISICGASELKYMSASSKLLLGIATHIRKYCYKNKWLVRNVAKLFNRPPSTHAIYEAHILNTNCAIRGLNKGIGDRARYLMHHKEPIANITTPAYILFSENDNNFSDPQTNAEHIASFYDTKAIFTLGNAGHGSFLEMPEKYDAVVEEIFSQIE